MIAYYRLWDYLNRHDKKKTDLLEAGLHPTTLAKLSKNKTVNTDTLSKICAYLECQPEDIIEYVPDQEEDK